MTAAIPARRNDILSGVAVLQGEELTQQLRPSIGETLARTPGVSATSFGPNASRPVLRGLQGERVRVLTDGIGSVDVSNTSVDHAVAINPLLAERVEVLRGPQALLYGSQAIGGVVNVIDRRIPRSVPDEPVHVDLLGTFGSAANERSLSGAVDVPLGGGLVGHADGSFIKTDDLHIGGCALTPELRAQALATGRLLGPVDGAGFTAAANVCGRLPNTASRTWTAAGGLAYIGESGSLGLAYSHFASLYGVPIRFATQPGEKAEAPRIDLVQNRLDARAEAEASGVFKRILFRYAYASYRHFELSPEGDVGTTFTDNAQEGRVELQQSRRGGWTGALGGQYFVRDFNVVGDEAFLPKSATEQIGLFAVQSVELGSLRLEAAGRFEHTNVSATPRPDQPQFFAGGRTFDLFSGSVGGTLSVEDGLRLGVNLARSLRAPSAEELFANGPHAGTQAFEVGDPAFGPERSTSIEGVFRYARHGVSLEASAYYNGFDGFIYERRTGAVEDGLPVFQSSQAPARFYGFEVQGTATLAEPGEGAITADLAADYVHATIQNVGPVPRIPPLRLLGGIGYSALRFDARVEAEHAFAQTRVAAFETPTPGFTLVNAEVGFRPFGKERPLSLTLSANNLFNVNARRHASFLKDYAPLAGRDIRLSARVEF